MPNINLNDNFNLHYIENGFGRPIIFVHGVWMSGKYFHKQVEELGQEFHAISIDLRGHGRSSHSNNGHTMGSYAKDLRAFIQAKNLKDVVLVGWSMGCMVIWDYFKQFGDIDVSATIFVDQSPSDFKWPDWELGVFDLSSLIAMMSDVQTNRDQVFKNFIPMLFNKTPPYDDMAWMLKESMLMPATIASAVLFDQAMQDYRKIVSKVNVPTLVISGGAEGKLLPIDSVKFVHEKIQGSHFSVYENTNHCPFLEETERFNNEVIQFVRSIN